MYKINEISPLRSDFLNILSSIEPDLKKIYYIGKLPEKRQITVAIVGSRKPTAYGREITYKIAYNLASRGAVIVSGLALGVDAIAHRGALDAGGITITVQANGLNRILPMTNRQLGEQIIAQNGAVISEYSPEVPASRYSFLRRNRIVSGISDAVIITEAASRSGTLNTASHALNQGKDLYIVPGDITSPLSAGCNSLLKQGANPIISIEDAVQSIIPQPSSDILSQKPRGANEAEQKIIDLIASDVRDGEAIHKQSKLEASEFNQTLTILEIKGVIQPLGANQWQLK
ncbi:DNA-protecting protein DprA [Candidatus Saccharibacteria bacterium]|nr:MAG: DNA-protecting protein DprA [Candidatus Saccharibacteria bacterium]